MGFLFFIKIYLSAIKILLKFHLNESFKGYYNNNFDISFTGPLGSFPSSYKL